MKIVKGFELNLTKWEVSDKNDESDEGGSDFGGWTLQDVLAESGGVLKENLVTKPRPDFLWRLHVGGEKLVPLWGGAPQVLFGVEAGGEEELGRQLDGYQSRLLGLRGCQGDLEEKKRGIQTMFLQNMQDVLVARSADWWSYFFESLNIRKRRKIVSVDSLFPLNSCPKSVCADKISFLPSDKHENETEITKVCKGWSQGRKLWNVTLIFSQNKTFRWERASFGINAGSFFDHFYGSGV